MSLGVRAGLQSSPWVIDYSDQDLTFFMVVFRNFELAKATLQERRSWCSPRICREAPPGGLARMGVCADDSRARNCTIRSSGEIHTAE